MDWLKKQASKTSLSKKKSYNEKTLLHGHLEIDVKQYANYLSVFKEYLFSSWGAGTQI